MVRETRFSWDATDHFTLPQTLESVLDEERFPRERTRSARKRRRRSGRSPQLQSREQTKLCAAVRDTAHSLSASERSNASQGLSASPASNASQGGSPLQRSRGRIAAVTTPKCHLAGANWLLPRKAK